MRWMAVESLEGNRFTQKSDIWSFGVVMFEIFSYGATPFGDLNTMIIPIKVCWLAPKTLPKSSPLTRAVRSSRWWMACAQSSRKDARTTCTHSCASAGSRLARVRCFRPPASSAHHVVYLPIGSLPLQNPDSRPAFSVLSNDFGELLKAERLKARARDLGKIFARALAPENEEATPVWTAPGLACAATTSHIFVAPPPPVQGPECRPRKGKRGASGAAAAAAPHGSKRPDAGGCAWAGCRQLGLWPTGRPREGKGLRRRSLHRPLAAQGLPVRGLGCARLCPVLPRRPLPHGSRAPSPQPGPTPRWVPLNATPMSTLGRHHL